MGQGRAMMCSRLGAAPAAQALAGAHSSCWGGWARSGAGGALTCRARRCTARRCARRGALSLQSCTRHQARPAVWEKRRQCWAAPATPNRCVHQARKPLPAPPPQARCPSAPCQGPRPIHLGSFAMYHSACRWWGQSFAFLWATAACGVAAPCCSAGVARRPCASGAPWAGVGLARRALGAPGPAAGCCWLVPGAGGAGCSLRTHSDRMRLTCAADGGGAALAGVRPLPALWGAPVGAVGAPRGAPPPTPPGPPLPPPCGPLPRPAGPSPPSHCCHARSARAACWSSLHTVMLERRSSRVG